MPQARAVRAGTSPMSPTSPTSPTSPRCASMASDARSCTAGAYPLCGRSGGWAWIRQGRASWTPRRGRPASGSCVSRQACSVASIRASLVRAPRSAANKTPVTLGLNLDDSTQEIACWILERDDLDVDCRSVPRVERSLTFEHHLVLHGVPGPRAQLEPGSVDGLAGTLAQAVLPAVELAQSVLDERE